MKNTLRYITISFSVLLGMISSNLSGQVVPLGFVNSKAEETIVIVEVTVAGKVWSKTNLDVTKYRNGEDIAYVDNETTWAAMTTGAWCYYGFDPNNASMGKYYNGYAVHDTRGLAPSGWHIPTKTEVSYAGFFDSVSKLRASSSWTLIGTDDYGFALMPTGRINDNGGSAFTAVGGEYTNLWLSSFNNGQVNQPETMKFLYNSENIEFTRPPTNGRYLKWGMTIRLMKD
ncbi:FISUMP domain-containing protein [Mongoliibacter sp.]|uniref:FISUMP domain-containing protein n=1 Tax=Mongoliibacter sp. TaxID=2022438 RepID=UPI0025D6AD63|nr:FISUMP domain-containing protein [Mongoliibacter sp.]